MSHNKEYVSLLSARQLRGGNMPHVPPPASPVSEVVRLELEAPPHSYPEAIFTDPRREHGWRVALAPVQAGSNLWQTSILLPQEPTILSYHFMLAGGTKIQEHRQKEGVVKPLFGVWEDQDFKIAVYNPKGNPPAWIAGQVFYQIFPDRFAQGNPDGLLKGPKSTYQYEVLAKNWDDLPERPPKSRDFFGGDLRGVINKLDYLEELGITCIYFTPIFDSPTNHRYDANDYFKVDPRLGTATDLQELIEKARAKGIRVMLDGVFNHCSRDSVYFKAAQADKLSPYYRWFNFTGWPEQWQSWMDVVDMPEFVECPEVEVFFFGKNGVAQHWLSYGTAGWRTDVTPWITDEWWRRFRAAVRRHYPDAYLIAEDWGDASPRLLGDSFDATMNYRFGYSVGGWAGGKLNPAELDDRLETLRRDTPPGQFQAQINLLGSHDTMRLLTKLEGHKDRVKLAIAFMLAYPGVPMIYYGDEVGLEGDYAEDGRRPYPWASPDQELLGFFQKAINTRNTSQALKFGDISTIYLDEHVYGFMRRYKDEVVMALFNNSTSSSPECVLPIDASLSSGQWLDLLNEHSSSLRLEEVEGDTKLKIIIQGLGMVWLQCQKN